MATRANGIAIGIALVLGMPRASLAQDPAASLDCDPKAGTLVIRYTPELGDEDPAWPEQPAPIHFGALLDLDEAETTVENTRAEFVSCRLGNDRLEATLAPGVGNPSLVGRCGAAFTGLLTLRRNEELILDELEFEDLNCHARERMLVRVTVRQGAAEPQLEYRSYEEAP